MILNFSKNPEMEIIDYWFRYANETCKAHQCNECPLVGYREIKTDVSILRCETGKDRKPKGKENEQGTGRKTDKTD